MFKCVLVGGALLLGLAACAGRAPDASLENLQRAAVGAGLTATASGAQVLVSGGTLTDAGKAVVRSVQASSVQYCQANYGVSLVPFENSVLALLQAAQGKYDVGTLGAAACEGLRALPAAYSAGSSAVAAPRPGAVVQGTARLPDGTSVPVQGQVGKAPARRPAKR